MQEFDEIIGYRAVRKGLEKIADTMRNRETYARLGVRSPRGLLLYGAPGVGKTLMANCLIKASGCHAYTIRKEESGADLIKKINKTFQEAAEHQPAILFLDDMDKFANVDQDHCDADEYVTIQSRIDESSQKDIFILATANVRGKLPRSLIRKGRFDRIIEVGLPSEEDAEKIIYSYLSRKGFSGDIDAKILAEILSGTSCAELETVVNEAGLLAGYERAGSITMDHLIRASLESVLDTQSYDEWDLESKEGEESEISEAALRQRAYHEAGHIVTAEMVSSGSVKLGMILRDNRKGKGGFIVTGKAIFEQNWENAAVVRLGGMAGTEQKTGKKDAGAALDLKQAFYMIRNGMKYTDYLGFHLHSYGYDNSEVLNARQELAVSIEAQKLYQEAKRIIAENMPFFEALVDELLEKDYILAKDIARIRKTIA